MFLSEQLDQEQALISKKDKHNAFSIEREFVNSKQFHDKFELLPVSKEVQEVLYIQAGRLLEFVDNLENEQIEEERMLAVNFRTGDFLVDNFGRKGEPSKTGFTPEEYKAIEKCKDGIILMHNHSHNVRPSIRDLLTYLSEEKLKLSIIVCHNGEIYAIYGVSKKLPDLYEEYYKRASTKTTDKKEANRLATTEIYRLNEKLGDRHKIFDVRKF